MPISKVLKSAVILLQHNFTSMWFMYFRQWTPTLVWKYYGMADMELRYRFPVNTRAPSAVCVENIQWSWIPSSLPIREDEWGLVLLCVSDLFLMSTESYYNLLNVKYRYVNKKAPSLVLNKCNIENEEILLNILMS